jgi:Zn-dependent metalloprotease
MADRGGRRALGAPCCCIVPPHLLRHLVDHCPPPLRASALQSLQHSERLRGQRDVLASVGAVGVAMPAGRRHRTIYDLRHGTRLPGTLVRNEGDPKGGDVHVNEAYDHSGATYDFFQQVYDRNSIDGDGMRLDSSVHYGIDYDNAFWNGAQMVYGDGDGEIFLRFTKCLEVVGHELTHGVTQFEAGLAYHDQSGALNESFSDVFGVLVKQWKLNQTAEEADWLVGTGLFTQRVQGRALRSLKAPGTAYDDPQLGRDPQPAHMKDYFQGIEDNGGVHINSGIPNHAFYLVAVELGGQAWQKAGRIWYEMLTRLLRADADFTQAAEAAVHAAGTLFGNASAEQRAVQSAWRHVGVL